MSIKWKIKIPNKYFIECIQNPLAFPPPPNPKLSKNIEYILVKKSRTSAKIPRQVIPYFFKFRKRHNKLPRFRGPVRVLVCDVRVLVCAVKVFVCAVKVFVCAVRVFVCAVSILLVLWAIWFWCEVFVAVVINSFVLWVICCCCDSYGSSYFILFRKLYLFGGTLVFENANFLRLVFCTYLALGKRH